MADNWVDDGSGTWAVIDGKYKMLGYSSGEFRYSTYDQIFNDFYYKADVMKEQGDRQWSKGIIFRFSYQGFYALLIDADGYISLFKILPNQSFTLIPWTYFSFINRGLNRWNNLRVICIGSNISIYVNNNFVKEIVDRSPILEGGVGIIAFDEETESGVQPIVSFDNTELKIIVGSEDT